MRRKTIQVKTTFKGLHNWPEASLFAGKDVTFLEHPHRHTFHVKASLQVTDSDREVEFFVFQKEIDTIIESLYPEEGLVRHLGRRSCETMAEEIIDVLRDKDYKGPLVVEVWEDDEVGAKVEDE